MMRPSRFAFVVLVISAGVSGCGGSNRGTVNGTVTLDGKPLAEGTVRFEPTNNKLGPAVTAPVKDGKFAVEVPVGDCRVEFSVAKVVGKIKMYDTPDSPSVDQTKETLPDRYNVKSELKTTVKGGSQDETYTLTSK